MKGRPNCRTCKHPNVELINTELALARSTEEIAKKFDVPARTLREHRSRCMTQQQIARLRHEIQPAHEVDIDELVRRGGQSAMLAFGRMMSELVTATAECDKLGLHREAATNRGLQLKVAIEQAKLANHYPGTKKVTNNLVIGDVGMLFDLIDSTLRPFPEARQAVAMAFANSQKPVLEHAA